jgi:NDP-sugar pyrophosphorylase family protein
MSLPVVILAGGLATRLRPVTESIPKSLVEVAGRPFAHHQLDLLRAQGIAEVVWLVGYRGSQIEASLGDGHQWGMRFAYLHDGATPAGTGGAIRRALPLLGSNFFVMYGDSYLECDFSAVAAAFARSGRNGLMTVFHNADRFDASNVEYAGGRIIRYDKRDRTPGMQHIDWGLGVFSAAAFAGYTPDRPLDLSAVYQDLLAAGQLAAFEVERRFHEIGSPEGLRETDTYLRRLRPKADE